MNNCRMALNGSTRCVEICAAYCYTYLTKQKSEIANTTLENAFLKDNLCNHILLKMILKKGRANRIFLYRNIFNKENYIILYGLFYNQSPSNFSKSSMRCNLPRPYHTHTFYLHPYHEANILLVPSPHLSTHLKMYYNNHL